MGLGPLAVLGLVALVAVVALVVVADDAEAAPTAAFSTDGAGGDLLTDDFTSDPNTGTTWTLFRNDDGTYTGVHNADGTLSLTKAVNSRSFAMFASEALTSPVFEAEWRYKVGGGNGADGFIFHFYRDTSAYLGAPPPGGSIGWTGDGYGIEFDSYTGNQNDPSCRHIALIEDTPTNHLNSVCDTRVRDNAWHHAKVTFDRGALKVYIDGGAVLSYNLPSPDYSFSGFGFSAGTGGFNDEHLIDKFAIRTPNIFSTAEVVNFVDASTDPTSDITAWSWTFGDGGTSTAQNPTHQYSDDGTYPVCLQVTNAAGQTDSTCQDLIITNVGPVASFLVVEDIQGLTQDPEFEDTSTDSDGSIVSRIWDFDDGSGTVTGATPTHRFPSSGTYRVCLQATDDDGASSLSCQDVVILIDESLPITTLSLAGTGPQNGWFRSDVTATLEATDTGSGVDAIYYKLDGGPLTQYTVPIAIPDEGVHSIEYHAVDNAGNVEATHTATIKIDLTAPTIVFDGRNPAPNGNGWHNTAVDLDWSCSDALSGVQSASVSTTVSSEGAGQSAAQTCQDLAGNTAGDTQPGIDIDLTKPGIVVAFRTPANADGWNNEPVTVEWACSDDLSGVEQGTVSATVSTEGKLQQVGRRCTDLAGNDRGHTQTNINIDLTDPVIAFDARTPANANGWNDGPVTVDWTCSDALSGEDQPAVSTTVSTEGADQSATETCEDLAGNTASDTQTGINIDLTDPVIAFNSRTPANANGWNNGPVTVDWACSDATSGVEQDSVSATVPTEGAGQSASQTCTDLAGNTASGTQPGIDIDLTAPTIVFDGRTPAPNGNGWHNTAVDLDWSCSDTLSGVVQGATSTTVSTEGSGQTASATCEDLAGNTASHTETGVNIDLTAPTVAVDTTCPTIGNDGWCRAPSVDYDARAGSVSGPSVCTEESPIRIYLHVNFGGGCIAYDGSRADFALDTFSDGASVDNEMSSIKLAPGWQVTLYDLPNFEGDSLVITESTSWIGDEFNDRPSSIRMDLSGASPETVTCTLNGNAAACSDTVAAEGTHTVTATVTDDAGHTATTTRTIKIDSVQPSITLDARTPANANGWNDGPVTVDWSCTDATSGVVAASLSETVSTEGAGQSTSATCEDQAGNTASDTQTSINIDLTDPVIAFDGRTPVPNANGWHNTAVDLAWSCSDALSGVVAASLSDTLSGEGADQSSTATCEDLAGNTASHTETDIDIDLTDPIVSLHQRTPAPNADGWNNEAVTVEWECTDPLSGTVHDFVSTVFSTEGKDQFSSIVCEDLAGNSKSAAHGPVSIDLTPPEIAFDAITPAPNANGWNDGPVTVSWTCSDALSGQVDASVDETVSTDGANQAATGTCQDIAGNTASDTKDGINIDSSGPTISFVARTLANANGWNDGPVTVDWTCSDALSGVESASVSTTVSAEGADQSATQACEDLAGNTASDTQTGINIDLTKPGISFVEQVPAKNANGWNNGPVTVEWACSDALSGVEEAAVFATVSTEGENQWVGRRCTDLAGNDRGHTYTDVDIDLTPPTITFDQRTPANANGWNDGPVTVDWTCSDALSGEVATAVSTTVSTEGADQSASQTCEDLAGNTASDTVGGINIDLSGPTIQFVSRTPANANGWNNGPVTLEWSCSDAGAGVQDATRSVTLSSEGAGQSASETCTDLAGNTASDTQTGIDIDLTDPVIAFDSRTPANANGWNDGPVTVDWTCTDALSGEDQAAVSTTVSTEGADQSASQTCEDLAGNTASDTQTGIDIDLTDPVIAFDSRTPANANGWNNGPVTVDWACSDATSGVEQDSVSATVSSEGAGQSASQTCEDLAGNTASDTHTGINIDLTKPSIAFVGQSPAKNEHGWNNGPVSFEWACSDGLSGVEQETVSATVSTEGKLQQVGRRCTDLAGNDFGNTQTQINIDLTDPVIAFDSRTPANANGWNDGPVTVDWTCSDALSGEDQAAVSTTVSTEGADQSATQTCEDLAGNTASDTVGGINIDLSGPTIQFVSRTPANANGWNNGPVTLEWSCSDAGSDVEEPSPTETVPTEGAGQSASQTCTDLAGNTASDTQTGIDIDLTDPVIAFDSRTPANANGWNDGPVTVDWTCTDALSGEDQAAVSTTVSTEGADQSATQTCEDLAGNTASDTQTGIDIDLTDPVIELESRTPANEHGWHAGDVDLVWSCSDLVSGVEEASRAATVSTEGADQSATETCTDLAGNTASDPQTGIHIDLTDPVIAFDSRTPANEHGWNNGPVAVDWTCSDELAGVEDATVSTTVSTEGAGQSASQTCTDLAGNAVSDTQTGIDIDLTDPVIGPHGDETEEATGPDGATVTYALPDGSDELSGPGTVSCEPPSGELFPLGSTTVTCSLEDLAGNAADQTTFIANVVDTTPPVIDGMEDVTFESTGPDGAVATWTDPATSDIVDGAGVATCEPASGTTFALGETTVTCTATDAAGNAADPVDFVVTVVDSTPPVIDPMADVTLEATGPDGAVATWTDPATSDIVDGAGVATCEPASGTTFAIGDTTVTCTAADAAGNEADPVQFVVHIVDTTPPELTMTLDGTEGEESWYRSHVTVTLECVDSTSGVDSIVYWVNGEGPNLYLMPFDVSAEGANEVEALCTDNWGNTDDAEATIHVDLTAPRGLVESPLAATIAYPVRYEVFDDGSGLSEVFVMERAVAESGLQHWPTICSVRDVEGPEASGLCWTDPLAGQYCYRLVVRDKAGNRWASFGADFVNELAVPNELSVSCTIKGTQGGATGGSSSAGDGTGADNNGTEPDHNNTAADNNGTEAGGNRTGSHEANATGPAHNPREVIPFVSGRLAVEVPAGVDGALVPTGEDQDQDGQGDAYELLGGSDPRDPRSVSTPFGPSVLPLPLAGPVPEF